MAKHTLFYYPYASFTDQQILLLNVAALWFDKLSSAIWSTQVEIPSAQENSMHHLLTI
jgi:hypothetical protein